MPKKKAYTAKLIAQDTYLIEEKTKVNQALCYLLIGTEKAMLIDTGVGYPDLKETIDALTDKPVFVANTHAHVDHIGGNHFFQEIWFHERDKEVFKLHINPKYTLNLLTETMPKFMVPILGLLSKQLLHVDPAGQYHYFGDGHIFELGGRKIEVIPIPGHTPGSVCFLDAQNRMLYSGDSVCEMGILLHFPKECCTPQEYLAALSKLMERQAEFDTLWPGHHGYPVEKAYMEEFRTCAQQIVEGTAVYKKVQGRKAACHGRIMISVKEEIA